MAKKNRLQKAFFDELKKIPIIQVACEKVGISRNSIYRWKREDENFAKDLEEALSIGEDFVNDMSESQLLQLIKEKNFSAVRFWLNKRHPAYKDKVEIIDKSQISDELTPEQQKIVNRALELSKIIKPHIKSYEK